MPNHWREKQLSPKAVASPTLTELNATSDGPRTKRATYVSPYSPSPPPSALQYSSSVSDSSSLGLHPRTAFTERDSFDDLSSSFRSLYKSIFGHSAQYGEYVNDVGGHGRTMPELNNSSSNLGLSNSSLPLGSSASALFGSIRNPQFTSLMDSFRDIAETNSWDKLDPAQIQGLMDSFKAGERDKFGLDPEMYAELHASFNQFLSQLNNKFLTDSSNNTPRLTEYNHHHHNVPVVSHGGHVMGGVGGILPKYHPHHQLDIISPLINVQTSAPTNYHPNGTPSPNRHTSPQGQLANMPVGSTPSHVNQQYGGYVNTGHAPPINSVPPPSGGVPIRSAATDLFDDDDDFDWSKLM